MLSDGVEWGTEPGSMRPGLHVSLAIVPSNRLTDIPVRVMNVRLEPMFIKSRTAVANLHLVTVVESVPKNVPA